MLSTVLLALAGASAAAWFAVLLLPWRPWDARPVGEDGPPPPEPARWPSVAVLVPARNEAELLPATLPRLAAQDYPGSFRVVLVDDRSEDGTAAVARSLGADVVEGAELPAGWAGKVWALEQAAREAGRPDYFLLTDADIRHAPGSLRRLVAESELDGLALNSRMARLRARSLAERLVVPPFVFFFGLLYPMRLVHRRPAAAGGCVLLRRDALERAGGFESIRGEVIDDLNLARRVADAGGPLRLALSREDVTSLRAHGSLGPLWRMVRRTAFTELRRSWLLLAVALLGLALLFPLPPLLVVLGPVLGAPWVALPAALSWAAMTLAFLPTLRFYELPQVWVLALPLAGTLYGAMTLDSAVRGRRGAW